MAANPIPVASAFISVLFLLGTLPAQTPDEATTTTEASKVRIVRLSEVKGVVKLDRNTGHGYEPVMANLPIVEHSRLQTGAGVAEVEFEDNSTLRVAPNSIVEFTELNRLPAGTTVSSVRLVKGTAYVSLLKTRQSRGNEFNILFGQQKVQLPPSSHIRLQVDDKQATLAVLDGTLSLDQSTEVHKKTVTFDLVDQAEPAIAKNIVPAPYDEWDKNAAAAHAQALVNTAFGSPYAYGIGDMMYYGSFTNVAGCGSVWRPYFASAAWNPYANGAWAWYQGAGYTWVSPYPWGWTPFHFGSWSYCSGAGWGWRPGGSWNGLNNTAAIVPTGGATGGAATGGGSTGGGSTGGSGTRPFPPRPVRPPRPGGTTFMVVNQAPLVRSEATANSFVFRKDSAGFGVPREGLGNLNKLSQDTVHRGVATTPVYFSNESAPSGNGRFNGPPNGNGRPTNESGRPANENIPVTSIHRGYAPPSTPGPSESGLYGGRTVAAADNGSGGGGSSGNAGGGGGNSGNSSPARPTSETTRSFAPQPSSPPPSAAPPPSSGPSPSPVSTGRNPR